jgi:hypothetical protein
MLMIWQIELHPVLGRCAAISTKINEKTNGVNHIIIITLRLNFLADTFDSIGVIWFSVSAVLLA